MNNHDGSNRLRYGRHSCVGQYYLITTSCYNNKPIFRQPEAAGIVLESLKWLDSKHRIALDAAVIMPDHIHFVAQLLNGRLSQIVHSLKGHTGRAINHFLGQSGPVWQSQYHDHALRNDEALSEVILYCLHNPVRAGLVEDFHLYPHWYCRYPV